MRYEIEIINEMLKRLKKMGFAIKDFEDKERELEKVAIAGGRLVFLAKRKGGNNSERADRQGSAKDVLESILQSEAKEEHSGEKARDI